MYLTNNIDIVQINIKQEVDEYYFPKNVNWRNKKVDKIAIAFAPEGVNIISPIDGQTQLIHRNLNAYIDLYAADDTQITRNLSVSEVINLNNNILPINQILSLNLSRLYFTKTPTEDCCALLYVYYDGKEVEDVEPSQKSITVSVPLTANGKMSLQDIVDNYIYMQPAKIKGIYMWNWESSPAYLTLRYADGIHVLNSILSSLCRPPMYQGNNGVGIKAETVQLHPLLFNNINIDMLNSFVQNAQNEAETVEITFLY